MFRTMLALPAVALGLLLPSLCWAQAEAKSDKVYVAFRLEDWKAKHINDAAQASQHAETLKTLGCEVKTNSHNGHTDVQCRTVYWKSLVVDSHEKAHDPSPFFRHQASSNLGHRPPLP